MMTLSNNLKIAILAQKPTEQQEDAIFTDELEFLLRAAPGSGKTWTSCRRFIWRGVEWPYSVGGLALLSFTNTAIREFKDSTIGVGQRGLLEDPNYVGTLDSFVERFILTPFGHLIKSTFEHPKLLHAPRLTDWSNNNLKLWVEKNNNKGSYPVHAWELIPYLDNNEVRYKASNGKDLGEKGSAQIHHLMSLGYYTHSQRIFWACELLQERPHIKMLLARRFPEVIIDEAQDCNSWQIKLLTLLRGEGTRITLVGDPDQCIFEFSMADPNSLQKLKEEWGIPEKPLNQSFRCNNQIAIAVRNVGSNDAFVGCGPEKNKWQSAFVLRVESNDFSEAISKLQQLVVKSGLDIGSSAVIARAHDQLDSIRGKLNFEKLKGKTKDLAKAAYLRDTQYDYRQAYKIVEGVLKDLTSEEGFWNEIEENPNSESAILVSMAIWKFVKSDESLPSISKISKDWLEKIKTSISILMGELGIGAGVKLGRNIRKTGLDETEIELPMFEAHDEVPKIRYETIHQVKGESIDAVLVVGSSKYWNSVVKAIQTGKNTEERRLAYVAMTRARHLLLVALPGEHYDEYIKTWSDCGFTDLT